jgi:hypothetical protein
MALCNIRSAFPPPIHPGHTAYDQDADLMQFRHPGYPDHNNILLVFPALDPTALPSTTTPHSFGLHHETARLGCAIAANNRWDGFLSEDKQPVAVPLEPDAILPAGTYYFHVPGPDERPYPVVPSFAHFQFPHGNLPPS